MIPYYQHAGITIYHGLAADTFGWQAYWKNEIAAKRLNQEVLQF